MSYDPFARGPHPVGVRTIDLRDGAGRPLTTEVWYPAAERHRGADVDARTRDAFDVLPSLPRASQLAVRDAEPIRDASPAPLSMYWHGGYGHRREASNICTHIASHGYVVGAPDFPGDHAGDVLPRAYGGNEKIATTPVDESAHNRPAQAVAALDGVLAAASELGLAIDEQKIGSLGTSMGGFTSLAVNSLDCRFGASFAMVPMYGTRGPAKVMQRLQGLLRVDDWGRPVPVLVLAAELDAIVILADLRELYLKLPAPKRFVVLERAGHMHFVDNAQGLHEMFRTAYLSGDFPDPDLDAIALGTAMRPFAELCPEQDANATARALCLAHMDAALRQNAAARSFLNGDLDSTFAKRGIALEAAA
jgi:dienelactone hydrolase